MKYNDIGINVDSIDKLILDIYGYAEKISTILNQISIQVDQTKSFYECESANTYRDKFDSFKTNFNIVDKNIISYADDLIKLKNRYEGISSDIAKLVNNATADMEIKKR